MDRLKTPQEREATKRQKETLARLTWFLVGVLMGAPIWFEVIGRQL